MAAIALRSEERIGLVVALAAHCALVALLLLKPHAAPVVMPPDRIEVTISDEVGLKSTSPEPRAQAAPDVAPELGEPAPPPEPVAAPPVPRAEPVRPEPPRPAVRPEPPKPAPRPVARPTMRPEPPRPVAKPTMRPTPRPPARPSARPAPRANLMPPPLPGMTASGRPTTRPGGTRVGSDFLRGVPGAQSQGQAHNPPAATAGPEVKASIGQAIARQLKPHWIAPQGVDAELLVTLVRFHLARDGSLIGDPQVVSQSGETAANKAQKARHAEQAIRAVRLAAPFDLPPDYYSAWQTVTSRFDKRLSQ